MIREVAVLAFLPLVLSQNYVYTQDWNTNGRLCLGETCLSSADVAYLKTHQPQSLSMSFRTVLDSSNFLYSESTSANNYSIRRMIGSNTPASFTFNLAAQKLISNVGCYLINGNTLALERNNGNLAVEDCYEAAARQGDLFYALQQYGRCSSGNLTNYGVNGYDALTSRMYTCTFNVSTSTPTTSMKCGDNSTASVYQINHAATQVLSESISNGTLVFSVLLSWSLILIRLGSIHKYRRISSDIQCISRIPPSRVDSYFYNIHDLQCALRVRYVHSNCVNHYSGQP